MSMQALERMIWISAKTVLNNPKLKMKEILEWRTTPIEQQSGEVMLFIPDQKVYVAVKIENDKRESKP